MIPWVIFKLIFVLFLLAVVIALLYLPIAILKSDRSIYCNVCIDYWLTAFVFACISTAFGYYIQIILMVLFYKGAWQSRYQIRKFYLYITIVASISVILGGIGLIMANTSPQSCLCQWSQKLLIWIYIIFGINLLIIMIRFCCLQNDKYNLGKSMEQIPLNTNTRNRTKKDVVVVKTKSKTNLNKTKSKIKSNIKPSSNITHLEKV